MKRRDLMRMAPAMVAAGALPPSALQAMGSDETPVMQLFREWEKHRAYINSPEGLALAEPEFDAALDVCHDLEVQMVNLPAQCAQDFIAKFVSWTGEGDFEAPNPKDFPGFWAEARALVSA